MPDFFKLAICHSERRVNSYLLMLFMQIQSPGTSSAYHKDCHVRNATMLLCEVHNDPWLFLSRFVVWLLIVSCWGLNIHAVMKKKVVVGGGGWLLRQMVCVNWNAHDARVQESPEEHRAVMSWSYLLISAVSPFNVVTEQCTCLCLYPPFCHPNHLHLLFHSYLIYTPDIHEMHKDIRYAGKCSPCLYAHDQALQLEHLHRALRVHICECTHCYACVCVLLCLAGGKQCGLS